MSSPCPCSSKALTGWRDRCQQATILQRACPSGTQASTNPQHSGTCHTQNQIVSSCSNIAELPHDRQSLTQTNAPSQHMFRNCACCLSLSGETCCSAQQKSKLMRRTSAKNWPKGVEPEIGGSVRIRVRLAARRDGCRTVARRCWNSSTLHASSGAGLVNAFACVHKILVNQEPERTTGQCNPTKTIIARDHRSKQKRLQGFTLHRKTGAGQRGC